MLLATPLPQNAVVDPSQNSVVAPIPSAPPLPQNEVVESSGGILHRGKKFILLLYLILNYYSVRYIEPRMNYEFIIDFNK